jgi:hypothetical protein
MPKIAEIRAPNTEERTEMNSLTRPTGIWLHCAAVGLLLLAAAAAAVSFSAQYELVFAARGIALAAALEAAIPDAAALVFACLGVALAVHGSHAVRARLLNAASAGTSVFMNVIAAAPGWRDVAVWVMPPAAYALASDTLIGVVRVRAAAPQRDLIAGAAADDSSMLAVVGGLVLWQRDSPLHVLWQRRPLACGVACSPSTAANAPGRPHGVPLDASRYGQVTTVATAERRPRRGGKGRAEPYCGHRAVTCYLAGQRPTRVTARLRQSASTLVSASNAAVTLVTLLGAVLGT